MQISGLPFELFTEKESNWSLDSDQSKLFASAIPLSDFFINPAAEVEIIANATTLLGNPPPGDFKFTCRIQAKLQSQFDAGVLMVWIDNSHWMKLCFEISPASENMVVSVVTNGVSDDSNAYVVDGDEIWYRVSRISNAYALHASLDGTKWNLIRLFSLGSDLATHKIGFEAQSPAGNGCQITFDSIHFESKTLANLRDGS